MSRSRARTPQLTFFAEGFLARTSPAPASDKDSAAPAPASGTTSRASSGKSHPDSSSSRTSPAAPRSGSRRSVKTSQTSAIERAPWGLPREIVAPHIAEHVCSWLPTLTASEGCNRGGAGGRTGKDRPSLSTMARRGELPTLTASSATRGKASRGPNAQGGPSLMEALLPTLTAKANLLSPSMVKWLAHARFATLCARDAKGPGTQRQGSKDLPAQRGGHLNPTWAEWFMGFPLGWTDGVDAPASVRSATRSSRSARKSSGS